VALPSGWERLSSEGPGPFVTSELVRAPDGTAVRWRSRAHRKGAHAAANDGAAGAREGAWWRPHQSGWWMAMLFAVGSSCFAIASLAAQWASSPRAAIGVTFFLGSLFFTSAAYLQYAEAVNVEHSLGPSSQRSRWRPASWEPRRIDWLASAVQLTGTVFFNISTFAAMKHGLTTHQRNARVWGPDALGSICFLIASELAYAEVCHRWLGRRQHSLSWWIVALNLLGSLAFGVSAIASLLAPSTGLPLSARLTNAGTALGALCFLAAALLLMPEASEEQRAATAQAAAHGSQATVRTGD
jgi:YrhK-like protein